MRCYQEGNNIIADAIAGSVHGWCNETGVCKQDEDVKEPGPNP